MRTSVSVLHPTVRPLHAQLRAVGDGAPAVTFKRERRPYRCACGDATTAKPRSTRGGVVIRCTPCWARQWALRAQMEQRAG